MRLILLHGVILVFIVAMVSGIHFQNVINCEDVSENFNISEVIPIRYDVRLVVRPHQRILAGFLNITIDVKKPTRNISLHAISTNRYNLSGEPESVPYNLSDFQYCMQKKILILKFGQPLAKGRYQFEIAYISVLNTGIQEVFYPTIWTSGNQTWILTNLYTPNGTRILFPCWDDPTIKATYNISVESPADYTVLSTIPEKSSYIHDPTVTRFGVKLTQFQEFVSMPTYLVAFLVVSDITMYSEQRDIHYMWHKTNAIQRHNNLLRTAEIATLFFTTIMGINSSDIPSKINHVILPNSPVRSMGAPGLVVYRERDITFNEDFDFSGRYVEVATLVTYEMARQLFVGIVSPNSNSDYVWLNEIFASYFSYYIMNELLLLTRVMELFVVKMIQPTLNNDILFETKPIIHKAKNSNGIDALLYPLLYHKKAFALIRMLFTLYKPETFKEAIRRYVSERYAIGNSICCTAPYCTMGDVYNGLSCLLHIGCMDVRVTKDVWTVLEEAHSLKFESNYPVKEIMNTWLTAKHHPELFIQRDYEGWMASCISLRTFIEGNPQWIIPINYITAATYGSYNISEVLWYKWGQVKSITAINSDDFLIVNTEQTGYYRVNYDTKNWLLISTYLQRYNFSHIPPINRAQLINDAYYYTTKFHLESNIFINITKFLKLDTDFIAWYPMFNIFSDMSAYFKFFESNRIKKHFLELLDGILTKIGYEDHARDDAMKKSLRYLARKWACKFGHSMCRNAAFHRLMVYIDTQDELEKIPAVSKEWILCDGMKVKDINAWKNILNKSMTYNNMELLEYLSCTENTSIIVHYLTLMLRTDYFAEIQEFMGPICFEIVKKHVEKGAVLRFVIDNYGEIVHRFSDNFPPGTLISHMIMNVYSWFNLHMVEQLADRICFTVVSSFSDAINILITQRKKYLTKVLSKFQMFHSQT